LAKNNETPPADQSKKPPIEDQLKGKTLKVYMYMVKKEPLGIREVQRELGFSSPSVANYHIDKLVGLALADQDKYGRYSMVQRVQVGSAASICQHQRADGAATVIFCCVFRHDANCLCCVEL
jgi:hypothetical protein